MGSDAEVFEFDYEAFQAEVVPAIQELVRTGRVQYPWLRWYPEWRGDGMSALQGHQADLARHCTWLGSDLGFPDGAERQVGPPCPSVTCAERHTCPLHESNSRHEEATYVVGGAFADAIALRCLGASRFVGRSRTPERLVDWLLECRIPVDDRLAELFDRLALRGRPLCWLDGYHEGIHGWLDPDETADLALLLDELPLPRYEASYERMDQLHRAYLRRDRGNLWSSHLGLSPALPDPDAFEWLSLSFVRTVAFLAAEQGNGVLWGNDVSVEYPRRLAAHYEHVRLQRAEAQPGPPFDRSG